MSLRERERAERCFAVARSTTFPAERETAISRGKAIANAAGLELESFDIPGEARRGPPPSRFADDIFSKPRSPFYSETWTREDLDDVLSHFQAELDRSMRDASDAELAKVRTEGSRRINRLNDAINFLWSRGVRLYPQDGLTLHGTYLAPEESDLEYNGNGVIELARARGWNR